MILNLRTWDGVFPRVWEHMNTHWGLTQKQKNKKTEIHSLTILEAGNPKSRCG